VHSLEEARSWIEARVDDVYGSRVGQVVDVYFDPEDQVVHWMLVRTGPEEGRLALVPVPYSIATRGHVWVPLTKDLIRRAPETPPGHGLSRDEELELCFHYGGLRRRSTGLYQRDAAELTAVPGATVLPFPPR
jgi:sporulation protein YlmC with PRC-barrel domain